MQREHVVGAESIVPSSAERLEDLGYRLWQNIAGGGPNRDRGIRAVWCRTVGIGGTSFSMPQYVPVRRRRFFSPTSFQSITSTPIPLILHLTVPSVHLHVEEVWRSRVRRGSNRTSLSAAATPCPPILRLSALCWVMGVWRCVWGRYGGFFSSFSNCALVASHALGATSRSLAGRITTP